jgi:hypothetical protein
MRDGFRICGKVSCYRLKPVLKDRVLIGEDLTRALYDGNAIHAFTRKNLIVDQGMEALAAFFGNNMGAPLVGGSTFGSIADITIGSMELGDTVGPATPVTGSTTSVGSLIYIPPITFSYSGTFSIQVNGVLPITEAVGVTVTEEALKLVNGKVMAKCIFSELKTNAYGLQFVHNISLARS